MPLFSHLFHLRPEDIGQLTYEEFGLYVEWADDWLRQQRENSS